jgi:hypothetical protein
MGSRSLGPVSLNSTMSTTKSSHIPQNTSDRALHLYCNPSSDALLRILRIYKAWDLKNYDLLFTIPSEKVQEIKIR